MTTARDLAASLAAKSPIALRLAKESMNRVEHLPLKDAYRAAFLETREPVWRWR